MMEGPWGKVVLFLMPADPATPGQEPPLCCAPGRSRGPRAAGLVVGVGVEDIKRKKRFGTTGLGEWDPWQEALEILTITELFGSGDYRDTHADSP